MSPNAALCLWTLAFCLAAGDTAVTTGVCKPGTTWMDDCNRCFCTETGLAACTLKGCINKHPSVYGNGGAEGGGSRAKREKVGVTTLACDPGETWMEYCNKCFCTDTGKAVCTKKLCGHLINLNPSAFDHGDTPSGAQGGSSRTKRGDGAVTTGGCKPGTTWMDDCNRCFCTSTGHAACTLKGCGPNFVDIHPSVFGNGGAEGGGSRAKREEVGVTTLACDPGETWMEYCNKCFCTDTGKAVCTKRVCGQLINLNPSAFGNEDTPSGAQGGSPRTKRGCKPGTGWHDGCNSCVCDRAGNEVCTQRACEPRQEQREKRHTTGCKPGTGWHDGCNNCVCNQAGNMICTQRACPPPKELREKRDNTE